MMRRIVIALAFFCLAVGLRAQTESDSRQTIETLMDDLSDSFDEDADLEQIAQRVPDCQSGQLRAIERPDAHHLRVGND